MPNLTNDPVFQLYALCSAVLVLILYGLGFMTAKTRADRKAVVNAEDAAINGGARLVETEHADVQRIKRAHLNALENSVPFFVIGLLYTLTSPGLTLARILLLTFVAVRLLHAVFYLTAKQPFRTMMFAICALINIVMVVQVIRFF
jgi:glutathione S-transferase